MTLTGMMRSEWRDRKGSSKERFGWYVYDFADQSYGSVVVTLFGTLFLNIIAEQHAFTSGTTPSCNSSVVCTTDRTSYLAGAAQCGAEPQRWEMRTLAPSAPSSRESLITRRRRRRRTGTAVSHPHR